MAKIIIKRKSGFVGSAQNHDVFLLNTFVGNLKTGGTLEIPADVGTHLLSFNSTMKRLGKNATFSVVINDPDEVVELKTYFDMDGQYRVSYTDNKPHIPTSETVTHAQPKVVNNTVSSIEQSSGFRCSRCGSHDIMPISEVSTHGKDFKAGDACCGYLLCGPLGLLCGATGKGKQTVTTTYWMCRSCGNKFKA